MLAVPENFVNALLSEVLGTVEPPIKKKAAKKPGFPEADTNKKFDAEDSAKEPERTVKPIYDDDDNSAPSVETKPEEGPRLSDTTDAANKLGSKREFKNRESNLDADALERGVAGPDYVAPVKKDDTRVGYGNPTRQQKKHPSTKLGSDVADRISRAHEKESGGSTDVVTTPTTRQETKPERDRRVFGDSGNRTFTPGEEAANVETRKLSKIRQKRSLYDRLKRNNLDKFEGRWSAGEDTREIGDKFSRDRMGIFGRDGKYKLSAAAARQRQEDNVDRQTVSTPGRTSRVIRPRPDNLVAPKPTALDRFNLRRQGTEANSGNTTPNARRSEPNPQDIIPNVTGRKKNGPWARTQALNASLDLSRTLRLKVLNENK